MFLVHSSKEKLKHGKPLAAAEPKSAQTDTALNETIQGAPAKSEGAAADTVKS